MLSTLVLQCLGSRYHFQESSNLHVHDYLVVEDTLFDEISRENHPDSLLEKKGTEVKDTMFEDTSAEEHLEDLAEKISLEDIVVEDTSLEDTIPNLECTVE